MYEYTVKLRDKHVEYCKKNNLKTISYSSLGNRVRSGWKEEDIIKTPNQGKGGARFSKKKKSLLSIYEANKKENSLSYSSFIWCIREYKLTIKQAITYVNLENRSAKSRTLFNNIESNVNSNTRIY